VPCKVCCNFKEKNWVLEMLKRGGGFEVLSGPTWEEEQMESSEPICYL
jgi:hypothetical protein